MLGEMLKISAKMRSVGSTYGAGAKGFGELLESALKPEAGSLGPTPTKKPFKKRWFKDVGSAKGNKSSFASTKSTVRTLGSAAGAFGSKAKSFLKANKTPALAIAALGSIPVGLYAYRKMRES